MSFITNPPPAPLLIAEAAASGATGAVPIPGDGLGVDLTVSVAASVTVQVSNHPEAQRVPGSATWHTVGTYSASTAFTVPGQFNWARLSWSGNTGTLTARANR
ncbi:MAG: hypothetical protein OEY97_11500 [Nitrospirota bacterium]|nr:hypothetical protein [Nitrospirota bacterium]